MPFTFFCFSILYLVFVWYLSWPTLCVYEQTGDDPWSNWRRTDDCPASHLFLIASHRHKSACPATLNQFACLFWFHYTNILPKAQKQKSIRSQNIKFVLFYTWSSEWLLRIILILINLSEAWEVPVVVFLVWTIVLAISTLIVLSCLRRFYLIIWCNPFDCTSPFLSSHCDNETELSLCDQFGCNSQLTTCKQQ